MLNLTFLLDKLRFIHTLTVGAADLEEDDNKYVENCLLTLTLKV